MSVYFKCATYMCAAVIATMFGCAGDSDKITNTLESSVSSAATVQIVADSWRLNRVPIAFARRTIQEAHDDLLTSSQTIERLKIDDSLRVHLYQETLSAARATAGVLETLDHLDTAGLSRSLRVVDEHHRALAALLEAANQAAQSK